MGRVFLISKYGNLKLGRSTEREIGFRGRGSTPLFAKFGFVVTEAPEYYFDMFTIA